MVIVSVNISNKGGSPDDVGEVTEGLENEQNHCESHVCMYI